MNWLKYNILLINIFLFSIGLLGQEVLTKEDAMKLTIENNYGVRVARNSVEIARNNTSKEMNGYLPTVNGSAGSNMSLGGSGQKLSSGEKNSTTNAFTWGGNASVSANYNLLDHARDDNFDQLKEVLNLSGLQLRQTLEINLLQLFRGYYNIARLTANLAQQENSLTLGKQRLLRAQYQYEYGQGIRLNVLNAEVDIQRDSITLVNLRQQLANAKRNLNVVMGQPVDTDFLVDTTVVYREDLLLSQLIQDATTNNVEMLAADKNLDISAYDLKIIDASRKPTLGTYANYSFNFQDSPKDFPTTFSNNRGLTVGVNLNWNIFDGGRRKIQKQNTNIAIQSQYIFKEQLKQELERDVLNAWESYQNALFILGAEEQNLETNQLNFERTQEQYNIGQVTSVEFRQAQLNLLLAGTNYNTARYDAKLIEIELLQLSGKLLDGEL